MILAALSLAVAQPAETPREFIDRIYSEYRTEGFNPLARPDSYFSRDLSASIQKDSSGGEVGYLDGDPLCDCQDYEALSATVLQIHQTSAKAAVAHVRVVLGSHAARNLQLRLIKTSAGWRIADVIGADHHSLYRELKRSNEKR